MNSKLTIQLDSFVIEKAKQYAQAQKTSLSKMIESYLRSVTSDEDRKEEIEISPLVRSVSGVITLPEKFDYKKEYLDHITQKHL